jgi:predicted phosphate transport protein (TIGR00153 family)
MFGWFQRLLPRSGDFFGMFERHAAALVAASDALASITRGQGDRAACIKVIHDREHDADDVIREVLHTVRRTFLTPFDRGAITALIGAMDDTIDEMQGAASAIELFDLTAFEPQMEQMAAVIVEAAGLIEEAMPLLRDVERHGHRLHELTGKLVRLEGDVDQLHHDGLKAKFKEQSNPGVKTLDFIVAREVYKRLENIADAFEDVANQIDSLVIDHA